MKKIKIEIKNRWTGKVLFEYESENNTIKETLNQAYLRGANLQGAYLQDANLRGANLQGAYLQGAYLRGAYLQGAYLRDAYLQDANLRGANLQGAYLQGANLKIIEHLFAIIPMEGSFIAYKKLQNECIAKIEIPAKSPRTYSLIGRKCRAKYVKTIEIIDSKGNKINEGTSNYNGKITIFKIGRLTYADKWDNNKLVECTHGIHFFITKQEALEWW